MGYYKNLLIEQQIELGDRVPAAKPASEHTALQNVSTVSSWWTTPRWPAIVSAGLTGLLVGILTGVAL